MNYVAYYRVSTNHQGINGLGMDAQRESVRRYLDGQPPLAEFSEVETGKRKDRPELLKAIALCREKKATLLIAKLDRLSRSASLIFGLRDSGVQFIACDMPGADHLTIGILAIIAEHEARCISQRTKEGLAAAKRRGVKMGNPNPGPSLKRAVAARMKKEREHREKVLPVVREIQGAGIESCKRIADCLNARGVKTVNGKMFAPQSVHNLLYGPPKPNTLDEKYRTSLLTLLGVTQ